jgi:hypothetical protein
VPGQTLHRGAVVVRVVQLAQHRAGLDAAVDVPGALRWRQLGQELLAPGLDVGHHRIAFFGGEQLRHCQMADVPVAC